MNNSERRLEFSCLEPSDTCPFIDEGLNASKIIRKSLDSITPYRGGELTVDSSELDFSYEFGDIDEAFERARSNAAAIRAWGNEWKNTALAFEEDANKWTALRVKLSFSFYLPSWQWDHNLENWRQGHCVISWFPFSIHFSYWPTVDNMWRDVR